MKPLLLAFYGDDFTGSTDVMEVLQWAGLRTVLFLEPPTVKQLAEFDNLRAFGVAGWSRTMSPAEMDAELLPALKCLRDSGATMVHYKTCSTFDSSREVGSIGRALELGQSVFGSSAIPIVIGAPKLGRYQAFGNLFARSGLDTEPFRLDRHPTMRQHPITPMAEADVREHLALQTDLKLGLYDCLRLAAVQSPELDDLPDCDALLFDVLYPEHLLRIGELIQALVDRVSTDGSPKFVLGSSGIEYALVEYWSRSGRHELVREDVSAARLAATKQLLVITGSCSPVNDRQITWAEQNGFEAIELDPAQLIDPDTREREIESSVQRGLDRLRRGANVILHSSRGPRDPRVAEALSAFRSLGFDELDIKLRSGRTLGPLLGRILAGILGEHPLARVAVAGGDTSGYVARELGVTALEAIAPVAPGSPICRAYADTRLDGVEFFFKGGQVGRDDVWGTMLHGSKD